MKALSRLVSTLFIAISLVVFASFASAETPPPDAKLTEAANRFAIGYVLTGDPALDEMSEAGLKGLSVQLAARTSVVPGPPVAIDLDYDDVSPMSLIYWPISADQYEPQPAAYLALSRWLRNGGTLLVDTRDADIAGFSGHDTNPELRRMLAPLAIPPLERVPSDHVLTRSYYLLRGFPGRYEGADVWVEAPEHGVDGERLSGLRNDGVTSVVIGGNAWAEAWAVDATGLPLAALGGHEGEVQREMSYRFGINLVMMALTGNYKSDQVHVRDVLDRLGRKDLLP